MTSNQKGTARRRSRPAPPRAQKDAVATRHLGRLYFAHAMPDYGTVKERDDLKVLRDKLPHFILVNPRDFQRECEKAADRMQFFLDLVRTCDGVAYSRFHGQVTAGVGKEIRLALQLRKPVYEVRDARIVPVARPPKSLTFEETIQRYYGPRLNRG